MQSTVGFPRIVRVGYHHDFGVLRVEELHDAFVVLFIDDPVVTMLVHAVTILFVVSALACWHILD
ncbi:MAG: hypothetical protein J07HX64_02178 [halophilic archaeon J07HX64]|nr:MAG: hypothetical protein J07HX64_02178 [halophilic archaeon J07HX64]